MVAAIFTNYLGGICGVRVSPGLIAVRAAILAVRIHQPVRLVWAARPLIPAHASLAGLVAPSAGLGEYFAAHSSAVAHGFGSHMT